MLEHGAETAGTSICLLVYVQHMLTDSSAEDEKKLRCTKFRLQIQAANSGGKLLPEFAA